VSRAKSYSNQGNKKLFLENDPKKALKYYDMGIALLPNEYALLVTRGMCLFELGNEDEARRDWERCRILSETDKVQIDSIYLTDIKKLKGYSEMIQLIQK
jgi:tetratricopeptide (TPR) repeat protein